ncbi:hypothetical protein LCGC14_0572760 [marine sediment metagenome]|uniref:Uncharacterized protein n=1 Tax=marine sediment metagenome TaxID=412755 RepID=A0A0F9RIS1_9ZZZZ
MNPIDAPAVLPVQQLQWCFVQRGSIPNNEGSSQLAFRKVPNDKQQRQLFANGASPFAGLRIYLGEDRHGDVQSGRLFYGHNMGQCNPNQLQAQSLNPPHNSELAHVRAFPYFPFLGGLPIDFLDIDVGNDIVKQNVLGYVDFHCLPI